MPIRLACPKCGKSLKAPDEAAGRIVACPNCQSNARVPKPTRSSEPLPRQDSELGTPAWIWAVVAVGACVPVALVVAIAANSRTGQSSTGTSGQATSTTNSPSPAASSERDGRIDAIVAEQARRRRESQELAQRQQREAQAQAERREREAREAAAAARRPKERYFRDSHGVIISESEAENKLRQIRSKISSMPDNAERAYMEGVLRAVEDEWARIKRQVPIER